MSVHPTALICPGAIIEENVKIGPFTVIGSNVKIGKNTEIGANCVIEGNTTIGEDNQIFPSVVIGTSPQDIKYKGETSYIKIGNANQLREFVTVHSAEGEGKTTIIGNNNLFMAYVHIAHNCEVGNGTIMSNASTLAGHVRVGDKAVLGGLTGVHQFCQVGSMAMIGGISKIVKDVPPFVKIDGNPARIIGLNSVGLKRNNVPKDSIINIRKLYKAFFCSELNVSQVLEDWENLVNFQDPYVKEFHDFIVSSRTSSRGVYKRTR